MLALLLPFLAVSSAIGAHERVVMSVGAGAEGRVNPIRRVVTLLQDMQMKVTEEGKKEKDLFEKFMCYCKTGSGELENSIAAAETKISQLDSAIKEGAALKQQLEDELVEHKVDRADAKDALAKAKALREKEAAAFAKESSELTTNIAALGKAIAALSKGAYGSFLQSTAAVAVRRLAIDADMSSTDREMLASFLSQGAGEGYAPQSGQIIGILKEMQDTMEKTLAGLIAEEEQAIQDYDGLVAAKEKEIAANTAAIEAKTERHGALSVELVNQAEDLDDTQKALAEDKQFLADLAKNCGTKKAEWEERSKMRSEELLALADTIKILNDDDALELFKKTLPSPILLQTKVTSKQVKLRALQALKASRDYRLSFIALALKGNSKSFDKVVKMIDDMVVLLGKEQVSDDDKKKFCESELDKAEDKKKVLDQKTADLDKAIEETKGEIATLTEEIAALEIGIKDLDKQVAEATETRKAEHAESVETLANDSAAKQLIEIAQNRLAKFYTPKLYKAAPKRELSAEDRILVSNGGTAPPTPAPGGIAGTGVSFLQEMPASLVQVTEHDQRDAPAPPPETWGDYERKGEAHVGVIEMLNMLKTDLDKEMAEVKTDEKDAQAEYETFMADAAAKRAADSKSITMKEGTKADLEAELQKMTAAKDSTMKEAMATAEYIKDLHLDCDWLLANFETRKAARAGEVESLKNAKAVLAGADYTLLQTGIAARYLRSGHA